MTPAARPRCLALAALLLPAAASFAQTADKDPAALVRQGQQAARQGKLEDALASYREALGAAPDSFPANLQAGVVLDLMGRYAEAREHFSRAIELSAGSRNKAQALRSMAMSYAFEQRCEDAARYESQLYQSYLAAGDFYNAGEIADELARVCLESGDLDAASRWYRSGYDAGLQEPDLKPDRMDLWEFRWEHAQARIAARRGNLDEARKHVAAAKTVLDKGTNPEQAPFFPYLTGYVAFHAGDYKAALADLEKANQRDPFILVLIAQTYERLGNHARALEYYRKVMESSAHNPPNALARPLARKKLG